MFAGWSLFLRPAADGSVRRAPRRVREGDDRRVMSRETTNHIPRRRVQRNRKVTPNQQDVWITAHNENERGDVTRSRRA